MKNIKWVKRKEFDSLFATVNAEGKNIWVIHRVKELPSEVIEIALRLSSLDFITHIRITDQVIAASSEIKGTRIKEPITELDHLTAISIEILYHIAYKVIDFFEINSPTRGKPKKVLRTDYICSLGNVIHTEGAAHRNILNNGKHIHTVLFSARICCKKQRCPDKKIMEK